jgi:SOS-response transcriptional repressor LexA
MTLLATRHAEFSVIDVALPGRAPESAGIVVRDPSSGDFRVKFRRDWDAFAGEEAEVLELLAEDFTSKLNERNGGDWLAFCEEHFSHTIRVTDRQQVLSADLDRTADRLYKQYVRPRVRPFVTHLPLYSARAAATKFVDNEEIHEEAWVEAPENLRLTPDLFLAHVVGRSMEPRIPDGSICLFRRYQGGTRQGKWWLIERLDVADQYTIKRYTSKTDPSEEGWRHTRIRLEPLNPEFDAWDLDSDDSFRTIGEFIRVFSVPDNENPGER